MPPSPTGAAYAFWLIPQEPLRSILRAIIERLADRWNAPRFEPHVTIYGGASSEAETRSIGARSAQRYGPLELAAEGLRQSDLFTKTFFIQFATSAALRQMSLDIHNATAEESDYELNPHLSLLYQNIAESERHTLCVETDCPKGVYRFDTLRVIHVPMPVTDAHAVENWSTVFEAKLEGVR